MKFHINRNRIRELETEIRLYATIVKNGLSSPKEIESYARAKLKLEESMLEYRERTGHEYSEKLKGRWDS